MINGLSSLNLTIEDERIFCALQKGALDEL